MTDWNAELDLLKEYINWRVDNFYHPPLTLTIGDIPHLNVEELFRIYSQMGVMYVNSDDMPSVTSRKISFEEWKLKRVA